MKKMMLPAAAAALLATPALADLASTLTPPRPMPAWPPPRPTS